MDDALQQLQPVLGAYRHQIDEMFDLVHNVEASFPRQQAKAIIDTRREIELLKRKVHPTLRVLTSLFREVESDDPMLSRFIEDSQGRLSWAIEELSVLLDACDSIKDDSAAYRSMQQNDVLYILTLITACMVPVQFLTGYFGMNFVNRDGTMGDPLLNLGTHGFYIFWGTGACFTIVAFFAFKYGQRFLRTGGHLVHLGRRASKRTAGKLQKTSKDLGRTISAGVKIREGSNASASGTWRGGETVVEQSEV